MKIQTEIETKLQNSFTPLHLDVENESYMHSVPEGSESHFKVVLVSDAFSGKRKVARHQAVYGVLSEEMSGKIHALALHTYTPDEWAERDKAPDSPQCLGGSKHDK